MQSDNMDYPISVRRRQDSRSEAGCDISSPFVPVPTVPIAGPYDFYHLSVIISGSCAAFSSIIVLMLMWQHVTHFSNPKEQIHILRICWFIAVYAIGIFIMILVPRTFVYLQSVLVIYESYALAYFYLLICQILAGPNAASQRDVFLAPLVAHAHRVGTSLPNRDSFFSPFNRFRIHWIGVFQCPVFMVFMTIAASVTQATDKYCLSSNKSYYAHIYVQVLQIVSKAAAILGVVHTYLPLRRELRRHRTLSKLWAFKLLIFLQVVQTFSFSIVNSRKGPAIEAYGTLSQIDILIGLPLLLVSCELTFFAVFYHYAYGTILYRLTHEQQQAGKRYDTPGWGVWIEMLKINDLVNAIKFMFRINKEVHLLELQMHMQDASSERREETVSSLKPEGDIGGENRAMVEIVESA
ncbi:organic solute transporter Ostalpha-domain-containing protein [Whalleya microplaca]|nr:organic solute transporter Ostalpha-domain-containing protein [Whalleya microplaca]